MAAEAEAAAAAGVKIWPIWRRKQTENIKSPQTGVKICKNANLNTKNAEITNEVIMCIFNAW